jgi:hypothetical protein
MNERAEKIFSKIENFFGRALDGKPPKAHIDRVATTATREMTGRESPGLPRLSFFPDSRFRRQKTEIEKIFSNGGPMGFT